MEKIHYHLQHKTQLFQDKSSEELNLIIKSDVHGSSEAIKNAIAVKLNMKK